MTAWPRIKRADKLIGLGVLGSVLVVWLVLVGFDTVIQLSSELGHVGENGYTATQAVLFILLTVPRRLYEMFGHAALIGSLLGLGGLAANSELTALRAAGMSRLRIMLSSLVMVALLTALVVALGETAGPAGEQQAQALKMSLHSSQLDLTTRSGLWARDGNVIINAKGARRLEEEEQTRVQLAEVRIFGLTEAGMLQRFVHAGSALSRHGSWTLHDVRVTRFDEDGAHSFKRAEMPWSTHLDPQLLTLSVVSPEYMSLRDLSRNIRYFRASGQSPSAFVEAWWAQVFYPLNVLLLVLAVLPMAFGSLRSGGLGKRIFIGIMLAIGWYFVQKALVSLGSVYGLQAWLANLLPAVLLAVVAVVHHRRTA